jgi:hypothetical protein
VPVPGPATAVPFVELATDCAPVAELFVVPAPPHPVVPPELGLVGVNVGPPDHAAAGPGAAGELPELFPAVWPNARATLAMTSDVATTDFIV